MRSIGHSQFIAQLHKEHRKLWLNNSTAIKHIEYFTQFAEFYRWTGRANRVQESVSVGSVTQSHRGRFDCKNIVTNAGTKSSHNDWKSMYKRNSVVSKNAHR